MNPVSSKSALANPAQAASGVADATPLANSAVACWPPLCEAGRVVAMMAAIEDEQCDAVIDSFPALIAEAEPWRRALADEASADLVAIMEPGIAALLAIHARGRDCRPAAMSLWSEFAAARAAMMLLLTPAVLPPEGQSA